MKSRITALLLISSLLFTCTGAAKADEVIPTRAEQVAAIHAQYDRLYDIQYARLMVIKAKVANDASMLGSFKLVLADFNGVRAFLTTNLANDTSDLKPSRVMQKKSLVNFRTPFIYWKSRPQRIRQLPVQRARWSRK